MAVRNPLVLVAGALQELPSGDTVNGASGGGASTPSSRLGVFPGVTGVVVGTSRFYPETDRTITGMVLWAGRAVPGTTTATLRKNGTSVGTCAITTGQILATETTLSVALTTTDYLTIDLNSPGAEDVAVRIDF